MPTPKPAWLPNGSTPAEERARLAGLTVPQLRREHMEMFCAYLNMSARVQDAKSGARRHTWALNVKRIRRLGRALHTAIDTGNMEDMFAARDEWDKPRRDFPPMFRNAGQEQANIERWDQLTLSREHMELWGAFVVMRSKKNAVQSTGERLVWSNTIKQARGLADAMRDAIDTGNMADRFAARDAWAADPIDARDD